MLKSAQMLRFRAQQRCLSSSRRSLYVTRSVALAASAGRQGVLSFLNERPLRRRNPIKPSLFRQLRIPIVLEPCAGLVIGPVSLRRGGGFRDRLVCRELLRASIRVEDEGCDERCRRRAEQTSDPRTAQSRPVTCCVNTKKATPKTKAAAVSIPKTHDHLVLTGTVKPILGRPWRCTSVGGSRGCLAVAEPSRSNHLLGVST